MACAKTVDEIAADLQKIIELIDPAEAQAADFHYAVAPTSQFCNSLCPSDGKTPIERRRFEVAGAGSGLHYGVAGGENVCPALANALHEYFGTAPTTRPAPPPPPETDEQRRARLETEDRERLVAVIATALKPGKVHSPEARARTLLHHLDGRYRI
jgi:hypothetical protein